MEADVLLLSNEMQNPNVRDAAATIQAKGNSCLIFAWHKFISNMLSSSSLNPCRRKSLGPEEHLIPVGNVYGP